MKKSLLIMTLLSLLLMGSKGSEMIKLTIINKSDMEIAIQLKGTDKICATCSDTVEGQFYYLTVPEGSKESPSIKIFEIEKNRYGMQVYFIETYDPVYGFKCNTPTPNRLDAARNIRLVVLPCDQTPLAIGEPSMRKFVPFPVPALFFISKYFVYRWIY
jgi:hypothetical protein